MDIARNWNAYWIGSGQTQASWQSPVHPAPFFRREFDFSGGRATAYFCGLGYGELYCNGEKVGGAVLDPAAGQYEKHVYYVRYELDSYLKKGRNTLGIVLGNGWYNCHTPEVWHFDKASWRDEPKAIFELVGDGGTVLRSDESWQCSGELGPIVFDGLRNGEFYDARREFPGWAENGFAAADWRNAVVVAPPGGVLVLETQPPCRVVNVVPPERAWNAKDGGRIFDLGIDISGWVELEVEGEAGAKVTLDYGEQLSPEGDDVSKFCVGKYIQGGEAQHDEYTLRGGGRERWEPRFTYHGFHYVKVVCTGAVKLLSVTGRIVRTDFAPIGEFASSNPELNRLFDCARRSFEGNFVGIPTDCPHREKNGWTGDAQLACEFGMTFYDAADSYAQWLRSVRDAQRASGQLPGIVPTGGWGFNWGSGPAWDSALFVLPETIYRHTGDKTILADNYAAMKKYITYLDSVAPDGIVRLGLGDWCPPDWDKMTPPELNTTAYYCADVELLSRFAAVLGNREDAEKYEEKAKFLASVFRRAFRNPDGTYGRGGMTDLATPLYFHLCEDSERAELGEKLSALAAAAEYKAEFGILGSKYVPRALADTGHLDAAVKIALQGEYPGWIHWVRQGASTLWETWSGTLPGCEISRNHVMFCDICAFLVEEVCGVKTSFEHPGFAELELKPKLPRELDFVRFTARTVRGGLSCDCRRSGGELEYTVCLAFPGAIRLPDGTRHECAAGTHHFRCVEA